MLQSQFKNDKRFEEMISFFLDTYFYKVNFPESRYFITRAKNKDLQCKGIDMVVVNAQTKGVTFIDEKCAAHYVNSPLSTFSFEITGTDGRPGWFIKDNMVTDYYFLTWVRVDEEKFSVLQECKATDYYKQVQDVDIKYVLGCLINKHRVLEYLGDYGLDRFSLYDQALKMRNEQIETEIINDFKFKYSYNNLREAPVNIIIPKVILQDLATNERGCFCYKVDKQNVETGVKLLDF